MFFHAEATEWGVDVSLRETARYIAVTSGADFDEAGDRAQNTEGKSEFKVSEDKIRLAAMALCEVNILQNDVPLSFVPAKNAGITYSEGDLEVIAYELAMESYRAEMVKTCKLNPFNFSFGTGDPEIAVEDIIKVTKDIYPPKGRCEIVKVKDGEAVIDYAHTPDAVEKIIDAFTENKKGRVITIVGCGGDRDPKKRPIMGNIAATKSDYVVFTSDNPRTEDPEAIMKDILAGVTTTNYEVELDRPTAIKKALDMLKKDDVVLILGKGHEDYQIIGHEKHHLDDSEEVRKYIENNK